MDPLFSPDRKTFSMLRPTPPVRLQPFRCFRIACTILAILACRFLSPTSADAQSARLSQQLADAAIQRHPVASANKAGQLWDDGFGKLSDALVEEWLGTANGDYFRYVKSAVDSRVGKDGTIVGPGGSPSVLKDFALGRQLVMLYQVTREDRYFRAASFLKGQLSAWPRDSRGEFLHERNGKSGLRVEDLYSLGPFFAAYAAAFQEPDDFKDIAEQFTQYAQHARNPVTGLVSPQMDDFSKDLRASAASGTADLRSTAIYAKALMETLEYIPPQSPVRAALLADLSKIAVATEGAISAHPGLVSAAGPAKSVDGTNNISTIAILTYVYANGFRLGYLPEIYSMLARKLYRTLPSYGADTDPALSGELILAGREMEIASIARHGRGDTVLLDAWFNSQTRANPAGKPEVFHYKWNDRSDSGFSFLGHLFNEYGFETETLDNSPTLQNLSSAQVYIVVSPDNPAKNPQPHYMTEQDAVQVAEWVRQGGVLLLMENDPGNADIDHADLLADKFGIHFENSFSHHVIGDTFSMGRIEAPADGELFKYSHVLYMKDTCTITVSGSARPLLVDRGDVMMATAKYGKGTVFAVVDPWLYNEYTDGRKLPAGYDNAGAARELLDWLLPHVSRGNRIETK